MRTEKVVGCTYVWTIGFSSHWMHSSSTGHHVHTGLIVNFLKSNPTPVKEFVFLVICFQKEPFICCLSTDRWKRLLTLIPMFKKNMVDLDLFSRSQEEQPCLFLNIKYIFVFFSKAAIQNLLKLGDVSWVDLY